MKKIINCSGMMSKLGVSISSKKVVNSVAESLQNFYVIDELKKAVGESIAKKLKFENAIVVNSASAGIVMALSSTKIKSEFNESDFFAIKNNIVIPKGHLINFNADISLGIKLSNSEIKTVGSKRITTLKDIQKAIDENTSAIFLVKSHYTSAIKIPTLASIKKIAKKHNIPLIIDAAAAENFSKYSKVANLVIGSGAKYFRGPTSGFIAGDKESIKRIFAIESTIGRYFKVGKEALIGLEAAIYQRKTSKIAFSLNDVLKEFKSNKKLSCSIVSDKVRPKIKRIKVKVKEGNAKEFINYLENGQVRIFTRNYQINKNIIHFDFRLVKKEQISEIVVKVRKW